MRFLLLNAGEASVEISQGFEVPADSETVWDLLLDVERVVPCMPGAELTETVDDRTFKGRATVKLGPVSMSFVGTVVLEQLDQPAGHMVMRAEGREQRGKGAATALVTLSFDRIEAGTAVTIVADLTVTGAVAQYGQGMILDITTRLTRDFADCLQRKITAEGLITPGVPAAADAAGLGNEESTTRLRTSGSGTPAVAVRPVKGLRLGSWALWRAVVRRIRQLFGKSSL